MQSEPTFQQLNELDMHEDGDVRFWPILRKYTAALRVLPLASRIQPVSMVVRSGRVI